MTLDELLVTHEPLIMFNANDGDYHIICNCWSHDELHEWDYIGHLKKVIKDFITLTAL